MPYGGKYRIIDFPLSNCTNSGIDVVGVLTQYQPLELNAYIGSGAPWDLDLTNGGVLRSAPLSVKGKSGEWYSRHGQRHLPEHGVHRAVSIRIMCSSSAATISTRWTTTTCCISTSDNKADCHHRRARSALGGCQPLRHHEHRRGRQHQSSSRKSPRSPKSNKASMGVYIFTWEKLRKYLIAGRRPTRPARNDFGKNIIPTMLADKQAHVRLRF